MTSMTTRIVSFLAIGPLLLLGAACASSMPPTDAVADALASMRGAEELGAARVPEAELQLQLAKEEVAQARRLMADGKHDRARYMAVRAVNDAELAIALTREAQARKAVEQARQRVESDAASADSSRANTNMAAPSTTQPTNTTRTPEMQQ